MDTLFLTNLGSPPLLFFFLGAAAVMLRSDLEIPTQIAKALSLYLLFAIGFKGGVALSESSLDASVGKGLLAALGLAIVVPVYVFYLMRRRLPVGKPKASGALRWRNTCRNSPSSLRRVSMAINMSLPISGVLVSILV